MNNMKTWTIITIALALLASCSGDKTDKNEESKGARISFTENVTTAEVELMAMETELTLAGKVEYDPDRIISYVPLIQGLVERTHFSLGDKVRKGQPLIDVRSSDLGALRSDLLAMEAELDVARRALENARTMHNDRMISDKDLLEADARFRQAEAAWERAHNDMEPWKTNGDGTFSILAPMNGYIVEKQVVPGSPVSPESSPLFVIADLNRVWITANVYASNLTQVREGMAVKISSLAYPGEVFEGEINALSQVFDPEEKALKARISMKNDNLKLKPEMAVLIRLVNNAKKQMIAVPTDAIIFDNNRHYVVTDEGNGNFVAKQITIAAARDNITYIAAGLELGNKIVTRNQLLIYEGLTGK
jgi:cobalt-zinc-cadmium efflux system membrane fusion protein